MVTRFDFGFVAPLSSVARSKPWKCSINGVSWASEGHDSAKLQSLLESHGIHPESAHRALDDVHGTLELLNRSDSAGQPYLKQLVNSPPEGFSSGGSGTDARIATDGSRPTHQQSDGPRASTRFATRKFWGCIAIPFGGLALLTLMASLLG